MRILVTGGAGYIGSVVVEELLAQGETAVVYDNLSKGHRESVAPGAEFIPGELLDSERLERVLAERQVEAVMHMAADSLVGESFQNPAKYYANNLVASLSLLKAMRAARVSRIVLSSTAAVYGEPEKQPSRRAMRRARQILTARPSWLWNGRCIGARRPRLALRQPALFQCRRGHRALR